MIRSGLALLAALQLVNSQALGQDVAPPPPPTEPEVAEPSTGQTVDSTTPSPVPATPTPEEKIFERSKKIKAVSDVKWKKLTDSSSNPAINENVLIAAGDTLSKISEKLFGSPYYWPKLWATNDPPILNPHLIEPGQNLVFISSADDPEVIRKQLEIPPTPPRSDEFKKITESQAWEINLPAKPEGFDELGMSLGSAPRARQPEKLRQSYLVQTSELPSLGKLRASTQNRNGYTSFDTVLVESNDGLQSGQTYGVVESVGTLKSEDGRRGTLYRFCGDVQITSGLDESLFVGRIVNGIHTCSRGAFLVAQVAVSNYPAPTPGNAMDIRIVSLSDRGEWPETQGPNRWVVLNRGSDDGVSAGMIYRAFHSKDPINDPITLQSPKFSAPEGMGLYPVADIQIIQVSEGLALGEIRAARDTVDPSAILQPLDSVVNLGRFEDLLPPENSPSLDLPPDASAPPVNSTDPAAPPVPATEDLETLDSNPSDDDDELTDAEKRELKQLENHQPTDASAVPPPTSDLEPPSDLPPADSAPVESSETLAPPADAPPDPAADDL